MVSEEFENPLDSMPIATNDNKYAPPEKMKDLDPTPRPEEEDDDWFDDGKKYSSRHKSTPDFEKSAEEVVTMHEKAYRIATAKYNPFAVGGSETLGGSENASRI
jgi:hypothetical protein